MTRIYTTREGAEWVVRECAPMPFAPGFFLGFRRDGQQVMIHEHRSREVSEAVQPKEMPEAKKGEA